MEIKFTEIEEKIFKTIREYALSLDPPTVPRLVGGFVRDKIMGIASSDIDIALDNISGYDFATGLSISQETSSSAHKIKANPDKSKHLETAILNLFGVNIDFAHLRQEEYADTRVPIIKPGTPVEDAFRRDITINALFYNLITCEIEDFTGFGLLDINNKLIRTPLDPEKTLLEDPLRILRIFRFKAKFDFKIDQKIYDALKNEEIYKALKTKVSEERIGIELMKMIQYNTGHIGLIELVENNYLHPISNISSKISINTERARDFYKSFTSCLAKIEEFCNKFSISLIYRISFEDEQKNSRGKIFVDILVLRLYILLQYFSGQKVPHLKKEEFFNVMFLKDSLKWPKSIFNYIKEIEENFEYIKINQSQSLVELVQTCGRSWLESLIISDIINESSKGITIIESIISQELYMSHLETPLITGHDLIELNVKKENFREFLRKAWLYQVENKISSKEKIVQYLKDFINEGKF